MKCDKCGAINTNTNFCVYCGAQLNSNPVNNNLVNMSVNNVKKKNVLPYIIGGLIVVGVIIFILFGARRSKFTGTWDCKGYLTSSGPSGDYMVTIELNSNGTYTFGKYGDLDKNHFSGKYTSKYESEKKKQYDKDFYILNFDIDEYIENGINQNKTSKMSFEMEFINDNETLIINTSSLSMYYCYKK